MHLPDSAISPTTSLAALAAMAPAWRIAALRVDRAAGSRQIPLTALGAAFCFVVMMLNVPVAGGATVHATGGALLAVLVGPWAAILGMTAVLTIQALLFADGGVLAIGANCFTMALAMPLTSYGAYRLLSGRGAAESPQRAVAAGVGAYVGAAAAALLTAVILGIQPALFRDDAGRALYFPLGLKVTIPALMTATLAATGILEGVVTFAAVRYLQAARIPLYEGPGESRRAARVEHAWTGLAILLALSPLSLLAAGKAWGEWSAQEMEQRVGYVPAGFARMEDRGWKAPGLLPDYLENQGPMGYLAAGAIGTATVAGVLALSLRRRRRGAVGAPAGGEATPGELPEWLRQSASDAPPAASPRHPSGRLVADHLEAAARAVHAALVLEEWANRPGLLQGIHPRAKLAGLLALLIAATTVRGAAGLLALGLVWCLLARLSAVSPLRLLGRATAAALLFGLPACLPATLNLVNPGPEAIALWNEPRISITWSGMAVASGLFARILLAALFTLLVAVTTRWRQILAALRLPGISRHFVAALTMMCRYIVSLSQAILDAMVARRSRSVGVPGPAAEMYAAGRTAGSLFRKAQALSEEVHDAMVSRGWLGEPRDLAGRRWGVRDTAAVSASLGLALLLILGERFA